MSSLFNALSVVRTPGHYNPFFYLFPIASLRHLFRLTLHKFPCLHLRIIFLTRYNPPAFHAKLSWQVSLPIELGYKKKSAAQKVQREGEGIVCSPKFVVCRKRPELAASRKAGSLCQDSVRFSIVLLPCWNPKKASLSGRFLC